MAMRGMRAGMHRDAGGADAAPATHSASPLTSRMALPSTTLTLISSCGWAMPLSCRSITRSSLGAMAAQGGGAAGAGLDGLILSVCVVVDRVAATGYCVRFNCVSRQAVSIMLLQAGGADVKLPTASNAGFKQHLRASQPSIIHQCSTQDTFSFLSVCGVLYTFSFHCH